MTTLYRKALVLALIAGAPASARAWQVPAPGTPANQIQRVIDGAGMRAQLQARLQASGMTPEQTRQRLAQAGYDPATLDPYLTNDGAPPPPTAAALDAARALSLLEVPAVPLSVLGAAATPFPTVPVAPVAEADTSTAPTVFGLSVFTRTTTQFQPVTAGPVPGSYVLGPGDELVLVLTGDVENSYSLPVTRDGFIVIPQVGQIWVNGVSIDRLRDQLYTHLGRVYSGVRRGASATTRFEITVGRLRTNQVFVTGDVAQPGTFLISPVASVLNALYLAGGPTETGTFRNIQVVRSGRAVYQVDLYEYLLAGNNMDSIRLQPGDVIFVPSHGPHVTLRGEVTHSAIYELRAGERLGDLLRYGRGARAPAALRRARITRILPSAERVTAGVSRVAIDAPLGEVVRGDAPGPVLVDGDDVSVFEVAGVVRNTVTIDGAVWQPGAFEFRPGMLAWDLIRRADGLNPRAHRRRAHIARVDPADSTLSLVAFSLDTTAAGQPVENPALAEFDVVTVYDETANIPPFVVTISGEVWSPRQATFREGMTLRDLILQSGGLTIVADLEVEVARYATQAEREQGRLANVMRVRLDSTYLMPEGLGQHYLGSLDSLRFRPATDEAGSFLLRPLDQVLVRRVPLLVLPRSVVVTGHVRSPGRYALRDRSERLGAFIQERARGLAPDAFAEGFRLYRNGRLVNVDLAAALRDPRDGNNVVLRDGDSLHVPEYEAIVTVQGAVNSPTTVLYRPGAGLGYYIANAGGYASNADVGRTHVRYANGAARVGGRRLLLFRTSPDPGPGSTVTVPVREEGERFDLRGLVADLLQIVTAVTTIIIVANR